MDPQEEVCLHPCGGCGLCSKGHLIHTTRITTQLAFWKVSDNVWHKRIVAF
jgi:hypothetical protein